MPKGLLVYLTSYSLLEALVSGVAGSVSGTGTSYRLIFGSQIWTGSGWRHVSMEHSKFILFSKTRKKTRCTHLEAQHGATAVEHLDAEGVDVGRAGRRAALFVPGVADNVKDETRVHLLRVGDAVAVVFGVEAPWGLVDVGRLMERKKEKRKKDDLTREHPSQIVSFCNNQEVGVSFWCCLQGAPHLPDAASGETRCLVAIGLRQAVEALLVLLQPRPVQRVVLAELDGEAAQDYGLKAGDETDMWKGESGKEVERHWSAPRRRLGCTERSVNIKTLISMRLNTRN